MFGTNQVCLKDFRVKSEILAWSSTILGTGFLFLFFPYAEGYGSQRVPMAKQWYDITATNENWQQCWLVLPFVAYAIWKSRVKMLSVASSGGALSVVFILFALALYFIGYRVENYYIGFISLHLLLVSLIIWFWGIHAAKEIAFPLLFLFFFWPFLFFDSLVAFPLRMIMSHASVAVLNLLGTPVILQGTGILSAPDPLVGLPVGKKFSVDVADPCSGIRSLFALMMVSALYAHFALESCWKKWILFLCSIPLAIVGNLVRILTLTLGTVAFGTEFAIGKNALTEPSWFHLGAGYMVFAVALGGMVGIGWLLNGGALGFAGRIRSFVTQNQLRSRTFENIGSGPPTSKNKRQDLY